MRFTDLSEKIPDRYLPPLDRERSPLKELDSEQESWKENGYLILPHFMPHDLIDRYCRRREKEEEWPTPTPYMTVDEIKDLCLYRPLMEILKKLIGAEMAMHLNLTGWVSTERNWHQDDYLNPYYIRGWYAAVWFALEDIHPDSGPFEYVPKSHTWPLLRRDKVLAHMPSGSVHNPAWPKLSEPFVAQAMEEEIQRMRA